MKRLILISLVSFLAFAQTQEATAQIFSTKLKITVLNDLGNVVEDARVTIYRNEADYIKETNAVQPYQLTDSKGRVTFKNLETRSYYVIVRKGDMDNSNGGEIISELSKGKVNKANIVISDGV